MLRSVSNKRVNILPRYLALRQQLKGKVIHRDASFFSVIEREVDKPAKIPTLDDIYDRVKARAKTRSKVEGTYLTSSTDNVLTPLSASRVQTWTLFEACLMSKDFERADLILQTMTEIKDLKNPNKLASFFTDGICEFLKFWGSLDSVKMSDVKGWLDHLSIKNSDFKTDPRVAAWLIKLSFAKGLPVDVVIGEISNYNNASFKSHRSDVLRYIDIIGIVNLRKLVSYAPDLRNDLPEDYKDLFEFIGSKEMISLENKVNLEAQLDESTEEKETLFASSTPSSSLESSLQQSTTQSSTGIPSEDLTATSTDSKTPQEATTTSMPLDQDPGTIKNNLGDLRSVSSFNLKVIRHSLLGLASSQNNGAFFKQLIALCKEAELNFNYEELEVKSKVLEIDLFDLKNTLSLEQQDKFDEILDQVSKERQIALESTMTEAARQKWAYDYETLKDKAIPSSIGVYLHLWLMELAPLIEREVKEYFEARDSFPALTADRINGEHMRVSKANKAKEDASTESYREKLKYGPFLALMKAEKLASIAIIEVIKQAVTGDPTRGLSVSRLVMSIGRAAELEHKSERILASDVDVNKYFKAMKKTNEFKRFIRGNKSSEYIQRANERKFPNKNTMQTESALQNWDVDTRCRVGSVLLSMLLKVAKIDVQGTDPTTGEVKKALAPAFYHTYDKINGGKVGVVKVNQRFTRKLGTDRLDNAIHSQALPMIAKPQPWTTYNDGGYYLSKHFVMRAKDAPEQHAYSKAAANNHKMDSVLLALNNLGYASWSINKKILEVMTEVWNSGEEFLEIPKVNGDALVLPPPPPKGSTVIEFIQHKQKCSEIANQFAKERSMRCDMNYKLEIARGFAGERIFFPHSLDFRGRAYPIPPHFNHLGSDLSRALLVYWKGKELGEHGLRWLKIHTCNLMGMDKITLDERVAYVDQHLDEILDSARDPLGGERSWMKADKPWQFLASAMELNEALKCDDPAKFISHQPVHQDGTCNGLQHYAALGGDVEGAKQVNLIPGDKPSDVYTHVAKLVTTSVEEDAKRGVPEAIAVRHVISRKLVKQTVMTSVYGVTFVGARAQVSKRLKEIDFDKDLAPDCSKYLTVKVFKAIRELFDGAHAIQDWLAIVAKRISKSIRLDVELTSTPEFMSSVIWTAPSGLPVVQPYRDGTQRMVQTNLQSIVITDPYEVKNVDARKQANGFPPNFIHSLDATHMMFSANKCSEQGLTFASVHDSYWTHATDTSKMNEILRDEFISLHKTNLIEKLKSEFEQRYSGFLMVASVDAKSDVAKAVKEFRKYLSTRLNRAATLADELKLERERITLLNSEDPKEVTLGRQLKTSISILEDIGYDQSYVDSSDGKFKILVPFEIPPIPPRGDFDVSVVKDSPYFFS